MTIFKAIITAADVIMMAMFIISTTKMGKNARALVAVLTILLTFNVLLLWYTS